MTPKEIFKHLALQMLPEALFDDTISRKQAARLFAQYVEVVEIENHSYCNRICSFCPNSFLDRRSQTITMSDHLFHKILADLASIHYRQTLVWSRYHEPLAHASIFDRVGEARKTLPGATLILVSNGDYLNPEVIRRLETSGMDRLLLDLYLPEGEERNSRKIQKALDQFRSRTKLTTQLQPGQTHDYECLGAKVRITMGIPFYDETNLSSRGGLIRHPKFERYRRYAICLAPIHSVVIDYNGKAMLCCQVRSDAPSHAEVDLGDLNDPDFDLFDFYRRLAVFRRGLVDAGPKKGVCETCSASDTTALSVHRNPRLASTLSKIPGFYPLFLGLNHLRRLKHRW